MNYDCMTAVRHEPVQEIEWPEDFRPRLSRGATEFLRDHPDEAGRVVEDALEAAANRSSPDIAHPPTYRLPELLRHFVGPSMPGHDVLNISEAAARLEVSRPTVYAWVEAKRMLAWRLGSLGPVVPAEQILGTGRLVPGLDRVLKVIPDPRLAWEFLAQELPFFEGDAKRPIDVLKAGDVEAVVKAANAYGDAFG